MHTSCIKIREEKENFVDKPETTNQFLRQEMESQSQDPTKNHIKQAGKQIYQTTATANRKRTLVTGKPRLLENNQGD